MKSYPEMPGCEVGSHSLKAFGYRLSEHKGEFNGPWDQWTQEMQTYCEQDVRVNTKLLKVMEQQGWPSDEAIKLEHRFNLFTHRIKQIGWKFDVDKAKSLYLDLKSKADTITDELKAIYPWAYEKQLKRPKYFEVEGERFETKGEARSWCSDEARRRGCKVKELAEKITDGPPQIRREPFNPLSRHQRADMLQKVYGWKPIEHTNDGIAQVDEATLLKQKGGVIPDEIIDKYVDLLTIGKRIGQIADGDNGWLRVERNGRIHHGIISTGTVTGRCSHVSPNLAQVPATRAEYGHECRELFCADPGMVMVGADASGLELRMLAHFLWPWDKGEYADIVLNGDVHSINQEAAGLPTRDHAKTFIYAYLYGAGDRKLGSIVDHTLPDRQQTKVGRELRAKFQSRFEAVAHLQHAIKTKAGFFEVTSRGRKFWRKRRDACGFIIGIDKRRLHLRSAHSALNVLLQSAGGLLVKEAASILAERLDAEGWECGLKGEQVWTPLGHCHDEMQCQTTPDKANQLGEMMVWAINESGRRYNMRLPIDGEFKVGPNWAATH